MDMPSALVLLFVVVLVSPLVGYVVVAWLRGERLDD